MTPQPQSAWDPTLGDPIQPASRLLTLNASRIRDFQRCRRLFFLAWILRLPGEQSAESDSDAAWIGSTTHEALHDLHELGTRVQHPEVSSVSVNETFIDPRASGMIRAHSTLCPSDKAEYLGGEVDTRWLITRKGVLLTGRFDALWRYPDGSLEVRDYKTGRCPDTLDNDLGAAMYLLLAANMTVSKSAASKSPVIRVVYESLASPNGREASLTATRSLLKSAYTEILRIAEHIRSERTFPANPSVSSCRTCAYQKSCPSSLA